MVFWWSFLWFSKYPKIHHTSHPHPLWMWCQFWPPLNHHWFFKTEILIWFLLPIFPVIFYTSFSVRTDTEVTTWGGIYVCACVYVHVYMCAYLIYGGNIYGATKRLRKNPDILLLCFFLPVSLFSSSNTHSQKTQFAQFKPEWPFIFNTKGKFCQFGKQHMCGCNFRGNSWTTWIFISSLVISIPIHDHFPTNFKFLIWGAQFIPLYRFTLISSLYFPSTV